LNYDQISPKIVLMKNKLMLLLVLVLLFVGFVLVRYFVFDKSNEYGKLKIISSPGASVFVNNTIIGKTPYDDKYKVGEYLLKLIPEGTATETASWNGKIKVYKNAMTYVNRELGSSDITSSGEVFTTEKMATSSDSSGEVYVETEPQGAIVTLDSDEKGTAPLILSSVSKGEHELSVYMPGFFRRTEKINVDSGYRVNASFKLALDPTQQKLEDKTKVASSSSSKNTTNYITIKSNEQGWLRVRADGMIDATEEAKVKVGEKYELLDEKTGWYKIKFNDNKDGLVSGEFAEGWISSEYSSKE